MSQKKEIASFLNQKPKWLVRNGILLIVGLFIALAISTLFIKETYQFRGRVSYLKPSPYQPGINPAGDWYISFVRTNGMVVSHGETLLSMYQIIPDTIALSSLIGFQSDNEPFPGHSQQINVSIKDTVIKSQHSGHWIVNKPLTVGEKVKISELNQTVVKTDSVFLYLHDFGSGKSLRPGNYAHFKVDGDAGIKARYIETNQSGSMVFLLDKFEPALMTDSSIELVFEPIPIFYSFF